MNCARWMSRYSGQTRRYRHVWHPAEYMIVMKILHTCENLSHENRLQRSQDLEYSSPPIMSGALHEIPRRFIL